ncbi:hypothetical protein HGRIS_005796 [Hohenbuehelia grisea]|uniref:Uncharacterized protein n=1 Tax=Hohenbuehelia grisea TaxID=104357 RepID=A0ABR3K004_9AGAR
MSSKKRKTTDSQAEAPANAAEHPPKRGPRKSVLPKISWTTDKSKIAWLLIAKMEENDNKKVLMGRRKTKGTTIQGDTKADVYRRIARELFPELYAIDASTISDRIKSICEWFRDRYKEFAKRLFRTGGGLDLESLPIPDQTAASEADDNNDIDDDDVRGTPF